MTLGGGSTTRERSPISFALSGCLHGGVLAWVILSGASQPEQRSKSIYDLEIRPHEKEIVWYSLREKLPEIGPAETRADTRPARAQAKAAQTMVAGARDDARPSTLIWAPDPEPAAPKETPLPNVVAMAPPKIVRPFVAPSARAAEEAALVMPEAPRLDAVSHPLAPPAVVAPVALTGAPRAFTPPPNVRMLRQAMLPLPEGPVPEMVVEPNGLPFPTTGPRPEPRRFVTPPAKQPAIATAALAAPPEAPAPNTRNAGLERVPRGFVPRAGPAKPAAAAAIATEPPAAPTAVGGTAVASLAIVGLDPAKVTVVPPPPASRTAGFSAGPETRKDGGTGTNGMALLNVPGLVVGGGAKDTQPTLAKPFSPTSRENLLAAARIAAGGPPKVPEEPLAPRVAEAPDPRLAGRAVYSIAIQMPNVTSFSGSWLVWFAEHVPLSGAPPKEMKPPGVVRKVDPKYVAAAVAERVEGIVRLFGVIGRDGRVAGITLVRGLDDRLDRSAQEALAKWEFTAAMRDGVPVEVDALFEIPFHLAPKPNQ